MLSKLLEEISNRIRSWLPLYTNGSLPVIKRWVVTLALRYSRSIKDDYQSFEFFRSRFINQPVFKPRSEVYLQIQNMVASQVQVPRKRQLDFKLWAIPVSLLIFAGVLLWQSLPPVISLGWSSQSQNVQSFKVYRLSSGRIYSEEDNNYQFLKEFPADLDEDTYTFTELPVFPGKEVIYRIDAIDEHGLVATTRTLVSDGLEALIGQLSLLIVVAFILYIVLFLLRHGLLYDLPKWPRFFLIES